jgi:Ca2+-binding EF-hand superfamily protein
MIAVASGFFGGVVGAVLQSQRLTKKHNKVKKDLHEYIKLQDEIARQREKAWQQEYQKLYKAYEELEKEAVERDYEEFKAPDTNNDDMISRSEFNTYVKKYLSSFPELSEKDFPKFEDFDLDGDGLVSFEEWQRFLVQQKLTEQKKGKAEKSTGNSAYQELLNALYEQSNQADSFNSLQKNMGSNSRSKNRSS